MAKRSLFNDISQGFAELKAEREDAENAKLQAALELICERPYQADTIAMNALKEVK